MTAARESRINVRPGALTAKRTLYRLAGVAPTPDAMYDALDHGQLAALDAQIHLPDDRLAAPSLLITAAMANEEASWCREVARTTGVRLVEPVRRTVERLFTSSPPVDLPVWATGVSEREYNEHVPKERPGYVCMDRKNVKNPLRSSDAFEVCDLLTPDNTLVMVKHAHGGSGPLSHLFSQGLVAYSC